jgi:phage repressor protein C with HTH and peptisase S24 domain
MLSHTQIWDAIDLLAAEHGLTVSGLARLSGLDPTTFNRSKRTNRGGKARWPSTESIAKILVATDTPLDRFYAFLRDKEATPQRTYPVHRLDSIVPAVQPSDETDSPIRAAAPMISLDDPAAFAIEVTGDGLEPIYRHGTILFVSPAAPIQAGDPVYITIEGGAGHVGRLLCRDRRKIAIHPLRIGDAEKMVFGNKSVVLVARILWAAL